MVFGEAMHVNAESVSERTAIVAQHQRSRRSRRSRTLQNFWPERKREP